jgi:3-dehydroquinate synthase
VTLFSELQTYLQSRNYSSIVLISDKNVFPLYGTDLVSRINCHPIIIKVGEASKSLEVATSCWNEMHAHGCDRQTLIIALGGGVVTDLAGFVAACYMRGVDVVHIPTTLMGMIDAAIGGKTGVNIPSGKNIVGAFHQPQKVIVQSSFLNTLPDREFIAGLAEIVKYAIITDVNLFELLENETNRILARDPEILEILLKRCYATKSEIVKADEKEQGVRALLNFGHTFGHAIECASHYKLYLHGEAVAIGINCAFYTSLLLNLIDATLIDRLHELLRRLKLPFSLPEALPAEELLYLMYGDKKTVDGKLNLILVKEIGQAILVKDVKADLVLKVLKKVKKP